MGLLDEAIRDHLELRRSHGVDPAVVAREELDALAPVEREEKPGRWSTLAEASADEAGAGRSPLGDARAVTRFDGDMVADGTTPSGADASRPRDTSFMEATAEIDMRAVLGELEHAMSGQEAGGEARIRRAVHAESATSLRTDAAARSAFDLEGGDLQPEAPGS
jgi:hypothetical protein